MQNPIQGILYGEKASGGYRMRKPLLLMVLMFLAVMSVGKMIFSYEEDPVEARVVTVVRDNVRQVAAITGRLMYADEKYVLATASGRVEKIYVEPGQRIAEGELLLRIDDTYQEKVVSAWLDKSTLIAGRLPDTGLDMVNMNNTVIRSEKACTVRQVLVEENTIIAVGTPMMRLSSNEQEIVCSVAPKDAKKVEIGMWAWISAEGQEMGKAVVQSVGETQVEATTGLQAVEVVLQPEIHMELPEGVAIDAEVFLAGADDALSIPIEAITSRGTVWWVNEGRCTEIPAQIVLCDEMRAWVNLPEGIQLAVGEFQEGQRITEATE